MRGPRGRDLPRWDLGAVFHPRSVCLVGISANRKSLNGLPLDRLLRHGFPGKVYLVNPKYDEISGHPCYPSVEAIPDSIDTALIMVPAAAVPQVIRDLGKKAARAAVVLSSGFEEAGSDELVEELKQSALEAGIAVVGPNCEGVWSVAARSLLTFGSAAARDKLLHAPVAVVSQSGALAGGIARQLQDGGTGCSYVVSVGNETLVGALDYVEYLIEQDDVRVILLFVEGLREGVRLPKVARRAKERGITLVALKAGNSAASSIATASHTGKIASRYSIYRDIFRDCGVVMVDSLTEMVEAAQALVSLPPPVDSPSANSGVSIFSIPGGTRAMTVDACEARGLPLAEFGEKTVAALSEKLPKFAYAKNPTDVTGQVLNSDSLLRDCLEIVCEEPSTEVLIVQLANRGPDDLRAHREVLAAVAERHRLPIIVSFLGDVLPAEERGAYARDGILLARDPVDAVRFAAYLYSAKEAGVADLGTDAKTPCLPVAGGWDSWMAALADCGFSVPRFALLEGRGVDCLHDKLDLPIALKALPEDAAHKTELGLLSLGLDTWDAVATEADRLRAAMKRPDAILLLQEMVEGGAEAMVSVHGDADFGPVLTLGIGGIFVEMIGEVRHFALPAQSAHVLAAIQEMKLGHLLSGFRGRLPLDAKALSRAAVAFGNAYARMPSSARPRSIEANPVIVQPEGQGAWVVDLLVEE